VLSDEEIAELVELGKRVEDHYGTPQDVEWAIYAGDIYMLQSRPITTIQEDAGAGETDTGESAENIAGKDDVDDDTSDGVAANGAGDRDDASDDADVLVNGLGASPGVVSGAVRIVHKLDHLDQVQEGDVMVTEMTMPDMVPAMKRAAGIITDEGGMTSHAAIISRELGVPAVVGTGNGTRVLNDGQNVTLDGDKGTVRAGATADAESGEEFEPVEAAAGDPRQADDGDGGEGERLDPGGGRAPRRRPAPTGSACFGSNTWCCRSGRLPRSISPTTAPARIRTNSSRASGGSPTSSIPGRSGSGPSMPRPTSSGNWRAARANRPNPIRCSAGAGSAAEP